MIFIEKTAHFRRLKKKRVTQGPTIRPTDGRTDRPTVRRTDPLIETRGRILKHENLEGKVSETAAISHVRHPYSFSVLSSVMCELHRKYGNMGGNF